MWCDLPADLLHHVLSNLPVVDVVRFSAVCSSWQSAHANNTALGIQYRPTPWLLLPSDAGEDSDTLIFRDLTILQQEVEEEGGIDVIVCHRHFSSLSSYIHGRRCMGSKNGWLVTLDKTKMKPHLFNPLTKAEISLPSLFTIPPDHMQSIKPEYASDGSIEYYVDEIRSCWETEAKLFRDVYIWKIVLSTNDPIGTVIVIYGYFKLMALLRPGDQAWVLGPLLPSNHIYYREQFEDVYYREEDQRFYAITTYSAVLSFDRNGQNVELVCSVEKICYTKYPSRMNYIAFLSETILRIERETTSITNSLKNFALKTNRISVFKLVEAVAASCSLSEWIPVKDLGDYSLFIGYNQTFSLHYTVAHGIRPNCIYFADHSWYMMPEDIQRDAGVFDLQNDSFEYFFDSNSLPTWPPLNIEKLRFLVKKITLFSCEETPRFLLI